MYETYQRIASLLLAIDNCRQEWVEKHEARLQAIMDSAPSGAGWDMGTTLDRGRSDPERLVFCGSYHHMDEGGFYDGWTDHTIVVKPSLVFGIDVRVTGRNRNDIKEYLTEMFSCWLQEEEKHP